MRMLFDAMVQRHGMMICHAGSDLMFWTASQCWAGLCWVLAEFVWWKRQMSSINKRYDQVIFAFLEISQNNHMRRWKWRIQIPQFWSVSPVLLLFKFGFLQDRFLEVFVLLIFSVPRLYYYRSCMCVSFSLWIGPRALPQTTQRAQEGKPSRLNAIAAAMCQMTKRVLSVMHDAAITRSCCSLQLLFWYCAFRSVFSWNEFHFYKVLCALPVTFSRVPWLSCLRWRRKDHLSRKVFYWDKWRVRVRNKLFEKENWQFAV